jgi:TPR repeat protein
MFAVPFLGLAVALSPALPHAPSISDTYRMRAERGSVRAQAVLGFQQNSVRWLRAAARQDDLECQLKTAEILRSRREYGEALYWYRRASKRSIQAVYALGSMYEAGEGMPQSYAAAARYYRRAGYNGSAEAQTRLGNLYMIGAGVALNYGEARRWYLRAAAQGYGDALLDLAGLFYQGLGVPRDLATARGWALAAKRARARDADSVLALLGE